MSEDYDSAKALATKILDDFNEAYANNAEPAWYGFVDGDEVEALARWVCVQRCDTCRWWSGHASARHGTCRVRASFPPGEGEMHIGVVGGEADVDLLTSASFGCVLWEPQDTEGDA